MTDSEGATVVFLRIADDGNFILVTGGVGPRVRYNSCTNLRVWEECGFWRRKK